MPIHASSSDYLGWNAQQLVHEITRLKNENARLDETVTRLNGDRTRLAGEYANVIADHQTTDQRRIQEINRLQGLVHSNVDQYARNNEELQEENNRLTDENKRLTEDGLGLLNANQKLSQKITRLQKLVTRECDLNGHDVETIYQVGKPDPVSLICRTCGKSWGVTAHD